MTDDGRMTQAKPLRSAVSRLSSIFGWLLVAIGALTDILYHIPILLFGLQWPPAVDAIGEFGHSVIFVGIVLLIFALLRRHQPNNAIQGHK